MKKNKKKNRKDEKVSFKEIRNSFYSRRDFEISNLWQRSIFLTAFLVLCFTGYGYLLTNFLNADITCAILQLLHEIACGISLVGIIFSVIWIKMAKGSKAWYEVYEQKIIKIEKEEELEIPERYRMGGTEFKCSANSMDTKFFSTGAGKYSVSKLNVVIGIVLLLIWSMLIMVHYTFAVWLLTQNSNFIHLIPVVIIPVLSVTILVTAKCNVWAKSGVLEGPDTERPPVISTSTTIILK